MSGFAQRPAGAALELAGKLDAAAAVVDDLRHELGELADAAGEDRGRGSQLVQLDVTRALVALGAAGLAIDRGRKHARLEP